MKEIAAYVFVLLIPVVAIGQDSALKEINLSSSNITLLDVSIIWGIINIESATNDDSIKIISKYDNVSKTELAQGAARLETKVNDNTLIVSSPQPQEGNFESYEVTIEVPAKTNLQLKMERGGEISVRDIDGSIEIDNHNGSTSVQGASSWITVNNFNGEINVSYKDIATVKAISLITFNGGIKLKLPEMINADVILRTKKNGWIHSDFPVVSTTGITYVNMLSKQYSKTSNQWNGRIGEGDAKIIAITNNGPIEILNAE